MYIFFTVHPKAFDIFFKQGLDRFPGETMMLTGIARIYEVIF